MGLDDENPKNYLIKDSVLLHKHNGKTQRPNKLKVKRT